MRTLALLLLLCAAGCASVKMTRAFNGVKVDNGYTPLATVSIENTGWFLFNCIPLASGNPERPNDADWHFFRNTVTLDNNMKMLDATMARHGATCFEHLTSHLKDDFYYFFILYRRTCQTSVVILRAEDNPSLDKKP